MKPPAARLAETQVMRPETSAIRSLSVRGATVPWLRIFRWTLSGFALKTCTIGVGFDGLRVATLGRAITIPPPISRPMVSTSTGSSTLG